MSRQPGIAPWIRFTEFDPSHHEFVMAGLKPEAHLHAAKARNASSSKWPDIHVFIIPPRKKDVVGRA
jgi:hypothetical protein